jgi:hypothetical protein
MGGHASAREVKDDVGDDLDPLGQDLPDPAIGLLRSDVGSSR